MHEETTKKQIELDAKWAWDTAGRIVGAAASLYESRAVLAAEILAQLERRSIR